MTDPTPTSSPAATLVERLAQQISTAASAQAVYGAPVERDGVTVIPVARAYYGFGAGGGARQSKGEGAGGGGGVAVTPVGYIELKNGRTRYRRIQSSVVPIVAVSGLVTLLLLRAVPKLLPNRRR